MVKNGKFVYRTSIRIDDKLKSIIEHTYRDVCNKTGLKKLSYGKMARAFWITIANNTALRKQCMKLVCDFILKQQEKKDKARLHARRIKPDR